MIRRKLTKPEKLTIETNIQSENTLGYGIFELIMKGKNTANTLFAMENHAYTNRKKKPNLGRYEKIRKEFESGEEDLFKRFLSVTSPEKPLKEYKFFDLFAGCGGMTQGLFQAGLQPVAAVEINPIACATHKKNFPNCFIHNKDIREFNPTDWTRDGSIEEINVIAGGPPCQGFSVAGKRDPNDERNRLFWEFVRIVKEIKPWYVVLENVPGILTMQKGQVYKTILGAFADIGYPNMSVNVLESATFGVPQFRPRAIFIANRFGLPNPYPNPQLTPDRYLPIESAISDLPPDTARPEINHEWTRHSQKMTARISKVPPGGSLYETFFDAWKRQYPGIPSMTIKENHGGTHIHPYLDRVISAREMARLQTFPDSFIFQGTMKQAMWQIGNAVPPRLAEVIGCALIPFLNAINQNDVANFDFGLVAKKNQLPLAI